MFFDDMYRYVLCGFGMIVFEHGYQSIDGLHALVMLVCDGRIQVEVRFDVGHDANHDKSEKLMVQS